MVVDWTQLACECGSIYFTPKLTLNWKPGGGTTDSPSGYVCRECHGDVDVGRLIQRAELTRKKAELAAIQAEIADAEPARPERTRARP